ncbi:MAG TPA: hypothetical protein VGS19_00510, partial [Streptosporangiaceae bacterium]|nr:hypothetical protein [Streptosporangiaceae bacterium]
VAPAEHELRRLTLTLSRYLRDVAPYDEAEAITSRTLPSWVPAAVDAREALHLAADSLDTGPGPPFSGAASEPADPLASHLAAAAISLSAGRDLLHTHTGTTAEGALLDRSEWAPVMRSAPVTRAVLEETAHWTARLTMLADMLSAACSARHVSPAPLDGARYWLLKATSALQQAKRAYPATGIDTGLLMAIPANAVPGRQPPQPPESITDLAEGMMGSATRLRATAAAMTGQAAWSPAATTDSWKRSATAAAIICHLSEHLLRSVAGRVSQWQQVAGTGPLLLAAADATAGSCAQWRKAVAAWGDLRTETRGLTGPGITDTNDLVLRAGRLAFTDPDWTPSRARRPVQVRGPADLAPEPPHAAALISALHHTTDALARMAAAVLRDVSAAAGAGRLYVPTRTLPDELNIFHPYWHAPQAAIDTVRTAYQQAENASAQAARALGAATVPFGVPRSTLAPQMTVASPAHSASTRHATAGPDQATTTGQAGIPRTGAMPPVGPVERALRGLGPADPGLLLRAKAIDKAGQKLITEARNEYARAETSSHVRGISVVATAAESFPHSPRPPHGPAGARLTHTQPSRPKPAPRL